MTGRVLLVGAPSPLGRAVGRALAVAGHEVVGVSRRGGASSAQLDVTNASETNDYFRANSPATVVYLARPALEDSSSVADSLASLQTFAEICVTRGVRQVVFASSAAVYGTTRIQAHRETEPLVARGLYASLKLQSEVLLTAVAAGSKLSALSLRIFNVYGPGFDDSLVNRLALGRKPIPVVHVSDTFVRDYVHSSDVARAITLAVDNEPVTVPVLNVGTGISTSNAQLVATMPEAPYISSLDETAESYSVADTSLASSVLGFEAMVSLREAVGDPALFFGERF